MTEKKSKKWTEKGAEFYRDFNIVTTLGSLAVGVLLPATAPVMNVLAGINALQAAGGEAVRRHIRRSNKNKLDDSKR